MFCDFHSLLIVQASVHFCPVNVALHADALIDNLLAVQAAIAAAPPVTPASAFIGLHVSGLHALKLSFRGVASIATVDPTVAAAEAAAVLAEENARVAAAAADAEKTRIVAQLAAEQVRGSGVVATFL